MIRLRSALLFGLACCVIPVPAYAQDEAGDSVLVDEGEGSGNSGRVAINIAAGDGNQQAGSAVVTIGDVAVLGHSLHQDMRDTTLGSDRATQIAIGAGAFSNNDGMLSLNITAGRHNQSANLASLTVSGAGMLSDQTLAQTSAPSAPAAPSAQATPSGNDVIAIDDAAFVGNSGLVQMNVVGGERNSSANTFALSFSAGGEQ